MMKTDESVLLREKFVERNIVLLCISHIFGNTSRKTKRESSGKNKPVKVAISTMKDLVDK